MMNLVNLCGFLKNKFVLFYFYYICNKYFLKIRNIDFIYINIDFNIDLIL